MQNTELRSIMTCPLNGKICEKGIRSDFESQKTECRWWVHLFGKDPQSEKIMDQWDCAIAWMPTCQIEGSQMTRQATASIDKVANVMAEIPLRLRNIQRPMIEVDQNGEK